MADKNNSKNVGCFIVVAAIIILWMDSWIKWLIVAALFVVYFVCLKNKVPAETASKPNNNEKDGLIPNFEIKYEDSDGEETLRKIYIKKIDGQMLVAHCFLRGEERSFYIPRITECIDLETGEVVTSDLKHYLLKKFKKDAKPCDVYRYEDWVERSYNKSKHVSEDVGEFDIDQKVKIRFVTYKEGVIQKELLLEKVRISSYEIDGLYVVLSDENGNRFNVGLSKIISVDGIDDFTSYIENRFYKSDNGRVQRLLSDYFNELSILVYLGRADTALTAKKRSRINEYLTQIGADSTDELIAKAARKVKVELADYKKIVNGFAKEISEEKKPILKDAAEFVVGGRDKAKPFGLAGLQYLDSKMRWT